MDENSSFPTAAPTAAAGDAVPAPRPQARRPQKRPAARKARLAAPLLDVGAAQTLLDSLVRQGETSLEEVVAQARESDVVFVVDDSSRITGVVVSPEFFSRLRGQAR